MQRFFWISASIALLAAAFATVVFALQENIPEDPMADVQWVATYPVPPERGQAIRDALRTVLLSDRASGQPLGHASLPMPDRLVVAAPMSSQGSIEAAIKSLSEGAPATVAPSRMTTLDLWVVGVEPTSGDDTEALASAQAALDAARSQFGEAHFRLLDRAMVVGVTDGEPLNAWTESLQFSTQLRAVDAQTIKARISLELFGPNAGRFGSELPLRDGQWQVIGMMRANQPGAPDRLLLLRQTTMAAPHSAS